MPTLIERANRSYGIEDNTGEMSFVEAHSLTIDDNGRLVFWCGFPKRIHAIIESGEWKRVLEGITLEDFKNGDTS
jgi:hypothetical protein